MNEKYNKLLETYKEYENQHEIRVDNEYESGILHGILYTLDVLDIRIKGINGEMKSSNK